VNPLQQDCSSGAGVDGSPLYGHTDTAEEDYVLNALDGLEPEVLCAGNARIVLSLQLAICTVVPACPAV
jgi:hypothetical protein